MTIDTIVLLVMFVSSPLIVYYCVKLGYVGFIRARQLMDQETYELWRKTNNADQK